MVGPGAHDRGADAVVTATFKSLDRALEAISAPSSAPIVATVESLGAAISLFEVRDL
jgi:hypothetical protein